MSKVLWKIFLSKREIFFFGYHSSGVTVRGSDLRLGTGAGGAGQLGDQGSPSRVASLIFYLKILCFRKIHKYPNIGLTSSPPSWDLQLCSTLVQPPPQCTGHASTDSCHTPELFPRTAPVLRNPRARFGLVSSTGCSSANFRRRSENILDQSQRRIVVT